MKDTISFRRYLQGDQFIWGISFLLAIISLVLVYNTTVLLAHKQVSGNIELYLARHFCIICMSITIMWFVHHIDYRYYGKLAIIGLYISALLLLITLQYGIQINKASRWLSIPFIHQSFQPSDLAQLVLIVYVAHILAKKQQALDDLSKWLFPIGSWYIILGILIAISNLSAALLLLLTCFLMMYLAGVPLRYLFSFILVTLLLGVFTCYIGQRGTTALNRIHDFFQKEKSFQAKQACIAIAKGSLLGKGLGKSEQKNFLPYPYCDFIYAILIEEYGLIGGIFLLLIYCALLYRCLRIANHSALTFGSLLSIGLGVNLALQAFLNISVVSSILPITGVNLPFISMGGSSLLFTGIALGMILNVSKDISIHRKRHDKKEKVFV